MSIVLVIIKAFFESVFLFVYKENGVRVPSRAMKRRWFAKRRTTKER